MPEPTGGEVLLQIQEYFGDLNDDRAYYRDWIGGTPTGGPNGDGLYPLPDFSGTVYMVPCPAKAIADLVSGGGAGIDPDTLPVAGSGDGGPNNLMIGVTPGGAVKKFTTNLFASRRTVDRDVLGGSEVAEWIDCLTSTGLERKIAMTALTRVMGEVIDPTRPPYNVVYDARRAKPMATTNGSNLVTAGDPVFNSARDLGKIMAVGNANASLGPMIGYIGQVVDAYNVRLFTDLTFSTAANATATRSTDECTWGTDNTTGLQAAFDAAEPTNIFDLGRVVVIGGMALARQLRFGSISVVGLADTGCGFIAHPGNSVQPWFADKAYVGAYTTYRADNYTIKNLSFYGQRFTAYYSAFRNAFEIRGGGFENFRRGAPYARVENIDVYDGQYNNIVTNGAFAGQFNSVRSYGSAQVGMRMGLWDLNGTNWHAEGNEGPGILSVMPGANVSLVRSSYNGSRGGLINLAGSYWPNEMGANLTECGFGNTWTNVRTQESWGHNICFSSTDPLGASSNLGTKNAVFLSTLDDTGNLVPAKGASASRLPEYRAMVFVKGSTANKNTVDLTTGSGQVHPTNYATNAYADSGNPTGNEVTLRTPGITNATGDWWAGNGAVSPGPWATASATGIAARGNVVTVNGATAP